MVDARSQSGAVGAGCHGFACAAGSSPCRETASTRTPPDGAAHGDGDVDRRQAGADEEHAVARLHDVERARRPRVGDQAARRQAGREHVRHRRGIVAERQDEVVDSDVRVVLGDDPRTRGEAEVRHALAHVRQLASRHRRGQAVREHRSQVLRVAPARHERGRLDAGPGTEVVGVVEEGTHAACWHVEEVPLVGRGVRDALAQRGPGLEDDDVDGHARLPQKERRDERAGRATAHDPDPDPIRMPLVDHEVPPVAHR